MSYYEAPFGGKFDDMCMALIAGGWTSKDADLMAETYEDITLDEAKRICKRIKELWED